MKAVGWKRFCFVSGAAVYLEKVWPAMREALLVKQWERAAAMQFCPSCMFMELVKDWWKFLEKAYLFWITPVL